LNYAIEIIPKAIFTLSDNILIFTLLFYKVIGSFNKHKLSVLFPTTCSIIYPSKDIPVGHNTFKGAIDSNLELSSA
jgi:hypothetical protein